MFMLYFIILLAYFSPGMMILGLAQVWMTDFPLLLALGWRIFSPPRMTLEYKSYMQSNLLVLIVAFVIWLVFVTIVTLPASADVPVASALFSLAGRFRPILFLLFCIPYASDREKLYKMFKFLIVLFVLQSVVVFCQKFNVAGINYWYSWRFRPVDVDKDIFYVIAAGRTTGTIGNANSLGTFMSIMAVVGYSVYALGKGYRNWIGLSMTFLAFIICIFFAKTRQGTLSIVLGCIAITLVALFLGKIGRLSFVIILVFLLSPVLTVYLLKDIALFERFAVLRGAEKITAVGSFQARLAIWPEFIGTYGGWIFIGKGMAGYISAIVWDSGWLMIIVGGGIPLALVYLWWMLRVSAACFKALPYRANDPELVGFLMAGPATTLIAIITNIVNNTYGDTKIAILIGLAYILSLGAAYELRYGTYDSMELYEQETYLPVQDDSDYYDIESGF
jgi:hypothetical protein